MILHVSCRNLYIYIYSKYNWIEIKEKRTRGNRSKRIDQFTSSMDESTFPRSFNYFKSTFQYESNYEAFFLTQFISLKTCQHRNTQKCNKQYIWPNMIEDHHASSLYVFTVSKNSQLIYHCDQTKHVLAHKSTPTTAIRLHSIHW